jgi:alanyl-tRNA synthetase
MTERLYYRDAGLRSFSAQLVEVQDGGRKVFLDRTAFYPTSGGQPHDLGALGGVNVVDVMDEGERVAHLLGDSLVVAIGSEVRGEIDWTRRHDHMQQHTGQHLISAVLEDRLGLRTVSVHFGPETSTLDVADEQGAGAVLEPAALASVEERVNEVVAESRVVTVTFENAATVAGLRKPTDRTGELRVVTIEGIDRSACGGTHVESTAGIGPVLLRRQERVRQGLRIEFVCGRRAIRRARRDLETLNRIARAYSASIDDAATLVEAQAVELRELQGEQKRAIESLAKYRAVELHAATTPNADGIRVVVERLTSGADSARSLALAISGLSRAVFVGASHSPPSILLATSADSGVDAGKTLRPILEGVGGRGGGSPRLAQGSAPSAEAVDQVVALLTASAIGAGASGTSVSRN